MNNTLHP